MKDIGVEVKQPEKECNDPKCPFHGDLKVHGQVIEGTVSSANMIKTVVVVREYLRYDKKYERYEKRRRKYHAHVPDCISVKEGDRVKIMECRPLAKTVSFVVIENLGGEER
ncbi:MAG: 30S ribosomal protein S17 [Thermoplasmata archaeon]